MSAIITTVSSVAIRIAVSNLKYEKVNSKKIIVVEIIAGTRGLDLFTMCPTQRVADLPRIPASIVSIAV